MTPHQIAKDYFALKKFPPPTVSVSALTFHILKFSLSLPCTAASPSTHSLPLLQSIVQVHTRPNLSPPPMMLAAMAFSSSHSLSLSLIWVSLFSPSLKPSRGRASASTHTYRRWRCLSSASQPLVATAPALLFFIFFLFYFFSIFICLLDRTETPLILILFHFFISLMNNILFQF